MKRCRQCKGPVPVYVTKHPDLRHVTSDGFCSRTCCEDWHGVERRPTAGMGMHYETREEVRYQ